MKPKVIFLLIIFFFAVGFVFAYDTETFGGVGSSEIEKAITVLTDCLSSAFVTSSSKKALDLPSTSVALDEEKRLPSRISFFIADPHDIMISMGKAHNSSFFAMVSKAATDPITTAVYLSLVSRDYEPNDYLVNGSVLFNYPESLSLQSLYNLGLKKQIESEEIVLDIDISIYGQKVKKPVSLYGKVSIFVDSENKIVIEPNEDFTVNGQNVYGLSFYV